MELPMTYNEAIVLAKEIGESLGGRQKLAIDTVLRYAARGVRPSSVRMNAVRDASFGAQHFAAAQNALDEGALEAKLKIDHAVGTAKERISQGLVAVGAAARELREQEMEALDELEPVDDKKKP